MNRIAQEDFWSTHPCGSDGNFAEKARQRRSIEPWISILLHGIAQKHGKVLEVGCGQGIEAYQYCSYIPSGAEYVGIDYSETSIKEAKALQGEATRTLALTVEPAFARADALCLPFPDGSFDGIYSIGVLHHTPDPAAAVDEIYRVLRGGGIAYIALYRKYSPKVAVAKGLRGIQWLVDAVFRTDRAFYRLLQGFHFRAWLGTMLLECFGVPYIFWYSRDEIDDLFRGFHLLDVTACGYNLPHVNPGGDGINANGYFWLIKAEKRG